MKKFLFLSTILLAFTTNLLAQDIVWTDATTLPVYGKIAQNTYEPFSRLPAELENVSRPPLWELGRHSAGLYLKFTTDAKMLAMRWTPVFHSNLDNISKICSGGLDLYALIDGKWQFVFVGRPNGEVPYYKSVNIELLGEGPKEFMLYLSTYDGVKTLELGVPQGCSLKASELNSPKSEKAVVMYGTSILQGASASRPGLAGTPLLSRMLDRQVINLGFSGSAVLDPEIADLMAAYPDPGVYVLDNVPNSDAQTVAAREESFFRTLRDAHPDVPVIFIECPIFIDCHYNSEFRKSILDRNVEFKKVFDKLKKDGEKNIYYITADKITGNDREATIDGTHFTDVGFKRYADVLYPLLKKLIK